MNKDTRAEKEVLILILMDVGFCELFRYFARNQLVKILFIRYFIFFVHFVQAIFVPYS